MNSKKDCENYEIVVASGEKQPACRIDKNTVNTYFNCDGCKRYNQSDKFKSYNVVAMNIWINQERMSSMKELIDKWFLIKGRTEIVTDDAREIGFKWSNYDKDTKILNLVEWKKEEPETLLAILFGEDKEYFIKRAEERSPLVSKKEVDNF